MMRSVTSAFRTVARTPFVTTVAVLSLALGIGANVAIFWLFDQILIRSVPVHDPRALVNSSSPGPMSGVTSCSQAGECDETFSYPMYKDLERSQTVLVGLAAHRPDLITAIRASAGQAAGARSATRFRSVLVTVQIALAMALLTCAGLFLKSLRNVNRVDVGANVGQVVTFAVSPVLNGYPSARSAVFFTQLEQALAATPGVTAVRAARVPFLAGSNWATDVSVEGFRSGTDIDSNARFNGVGTKYLATLGLPLITGREFTESDGLGAPRVAIVNEAFAKKFNLGRDALGKRMSTNSSPDAELNIEIVGLMQDAKVSDVKDPPPPLFFFPYRQDSTVGAITYYVRTAGDPATLLRSIPEVVAKLDPNLPVEELKTLPQQVRENVFVDRVVSRLSAALATLLAAIGPYGVLAYTVAQRTREIGVRMALGANAGAVRGMVLRYVGFVTVIGGTIGVLGALGLGRAAQSLLFDLKGHDPLVFTLSAAVPGAVGFAAGDIPALRASRVNPRRALRHE